MTVTNLTPVQKELFDAVDPVFFANPQTPESMLDEIVNPDLPGHPNFWWWDAVDGTVCTVWRELSLDAKLVACINACNGLDMSPGWNE